MKTTIKRTGVGEYIINGELDLDTMIIITHLEGEEPKIEKLDEYIK